MVFNVALNFRSLARFSERFNSRYISESFRKYYEFEIKTKPAPTVWYFNAITTFQTISNIGFFLRMAATTDAPVWIVNFISRWLFSRSGIITFCSVTYVSMASQTNFNSKELQTSPMSLFFNKVSFIPMRVPYIIQNSQDNLKRTMQRTH